MRRSLVIRAQAFALLLTLVGGSFGLPLVDSLVFHSWPGSFTPERTLGKTGANPTHIQVCPLQRPALADRCLPGEPTVIRIGLPDSPLTIVAIESPTGRLAGALPHSRAPPLRA